MQILLDQHLDLKRLQVDLLQNQEVQTDQIADLEEEDKFYNA